MGSKFWNVDQYPLVISDFSETGYRAHRLLPMGLYSVTGVWVIFCFEKTYAVNEDDKFETGQELH